MTREQLKVLAKHSNVNADAIRILLRRNVWPSNEAWMKFIRLSLLVMGVGFLTAGVGFFFAYNWDALHKFAKLGIIQFITLATASAWFVKKWPPLVRNISLTSSAALVGVLFAVYGQVYQTEAMAYDLVRNWWMVVTPMALVGGFAPLTLLWVILMNVTIGAYHEQVLRTWSEPSVLLLLAFANLIVVVTTMILNHKMIFIQTAKWFEYVLTVAILILLTLLVVVGLDTPTDPTFIIGSLTTALSFGFLIREAQKQKTIIPLVLVTLSGLIIFSALILEIDNDEAGTLFLSVFLIVSTSLITRQLLHLKKSWSRDEE